MQKGLSHRHQYWRIYEVLDKLTSRWIDWSPDIRLGTGVHRRVSTYLSFHSLMKIPHREEGDNNIRALFYDLACEYAKRPEVS